MEVDGDVGFNKLDFELAEPASGTTEGLEQRATLKLRSWLDSRRKFDAILSTDDGIPRSSEISRVFISLSGTSTT